MDLAQPAQYTAREVHRYDGVTGRLVHRFAIPRPTLQMLVPFGRSRQRVFLARLLATMLVDEQSVYLSTADSRGTMKPVVAAFAHSGTPCWVWQSASRRGVLKLRALHESGIVLLEVTPGRRAISRLILLDQGKGTERREVRLKGAARILNPNPEPVAPDLLLLEENQASTSLVGFSLTKRTPSFRKDTGQRRMFWKSPVIGRDFLAAPMLGQRAVRMEMLVLRLRDRKSALPAAGRQSVFPTGASGYRLLAHDRYTICQTPKGLLVFGDKEKPK